MDEWSFQYFESVNDETNDQFMFISALRVRQEQHLQNFSSETRDRVERSSWRSESTLPHELMIWRRSRETDFETDKSDEWRSTCRESSHHGILGITNERLIQNGTTFEIISSVIDYECLSRAVMHFFTDWFSVVRVAIRNP